MFHLTLTGLLLSCVSVGKNHRVYKGLPPIAVEFYTCKKCGSYDGGLYGKGPLKHYRTRQGEDCWHDWTPISRREFAIGVSKHFGVDWSAERSHFWQGLAAEVPPYAANEPSSKVPSDGRPGSAE